VKIKGLETLINNTTIFNQYDFERGNSSTMKRKGTSLKLDS